VTKVDDHYEKTEMATKGANDIKTMTGAKASAGERFRALTAALQALGSRIESGMSHVGVDALEAVNACIDDIETHGRRQIPADAELRMFYQSLIDVDRNSSTVLTWALDPAPDVAAQRWPTVHGYLRIAIRIKTVSVRGLWGAAQRVVDAGTLSALVRLGVGEAHVDQLSSLLRDLIRERFITPHALHCARDEAEDVAARTFLAEFVASQLQLMGA
jgi:hypothetical protein